MAHVIGSKIANELVNEIELLQALNTVVKSIRGEVPEDIKKRIRQAQDNIISLNRQIRDRQYILNAGSTTFHKDLRSDDLKLELAPKYVQLKSLLDDILEGKDAAAITHAIKLCDEIETLLHPRLHPRRIWRPMFIFGFKPVRLYPEE